MENIIIAEGNFGQVMKAVVKKEGVAIEAAVKVLKGKYGISIEVEFLAGFVLTSFRKVLLPFMFVRILFCRAKYKRSICKYKARDCGFKHLISGQSITVIKGCKHFCRYYV